jgi:hypothetical protein
VANLIQFARNGPKMGCIVIDPPWPIAGAVLPYMYVHVDALKALPVVRSTSCRPISMPGSPIKTAHRNTHLSMSLKKRGFVDRGAIPWGVSGSAARVP